MTEKTAGRGKKKENIQKEKKKNLHPNNATCFQAVHLNKLHQHFLFYFKEKHYRRKCANYNELTHSIASYIT